MSREIAEALNEIARSGQGTRPGLWTGRVEDVDDPLKLNRIRVRVLLVHGDKRTMATSALPWCEVVDFGGGGPDYGSGGRVYPVGSTVWVSYEMGDERRPVVIGGRRGSSERDDKNPVEFLTVDGDSYNKIEDTWLPDEGNEIPRDVFSDSAEDDTHPTRVVWNKSFRGHTILVEDRAGHEFVRIIDRAGQVIEMDCPVTASANSNNGEQRGGRNSIDDTQIQQSSLVNGRAYIRLKDVAGQELILDGKSNEEEIRIISRSRSGSTRQQVVLSSKKGAEKITVIDKAGNSLVLDPNGDETIALTDYAGNRIAFDQENGVASYTATADETSSVGRDRTLEVAGKLSETIGGDRDARTLGNHLLSVMNDLSANVSGMASAIVSGALQLQVVNAPADGTPKATGFEVNVATGDTSVVNEIGQSTLSSKLGNINLLPEPSSGTVNNGSTTPGDAVALDSKAQTELARLKEDFYAFRDQIGRLRAPLPEFPFPLVFGDLTETFAQPLLYTIKDQPVYNIRTGKEAKPNNAPMNMCDAVDDVAYYIKDPLRPGESGVIDPPSSPGPTNSERVLTDK